MNEFKSYVSLFQGLPEAAVVLLPDAPKFTIVEVNKAHLEYSGKKREELIQKPLATAFPDNPGTGESAGLQMLKKSFQRVVDTEKEDKLSEFRYDVEDPETGEFSQRYWSCINKPIFDDSGNLVYILHTVKEVTDEIKTRESLKNNLRDRNILFSQAESLSNIGSWELDLKTEEIFWSDGVYKIVGYNPDEYELTYDSAMNIIHPEDRDHALNQMRKALESGDHYEVEKRFLHKDGSIRQIISRGTIKKDSDGKPVKLIGIFQDVTEEVNLYTEYEQAIYELRERAKEQRCLYAISNLNERKLSIDDLLNQSISIIPDGFQYPDIAGVRIEFGEKEFVSEIFEDSKWNIKAISNQIQDQNVKITVSYSENVWPANKQPFIEEEKELLTSAVDQISLKVAKILQRKELLESKNHIQKILNQSLDVICTIDGAGKFVSVSEAAKTVWGYDPNEVEGKRYMDLVYPDDHELTSKVAQKIMDGEEFTNFENRYVKKDGSVVHIIWSARWDEDDELMYCVAKDATEIKRAEKVTEIEKERYKRMFTQLPAYFCMLHGPDHRYEMVNPGYLQLIGKSDIIGKTVTEVLPETEGQPVLELLDKAYNTGETVEENEIPLELDRNEDGNLETIYLNFSFIPDKNSSGEVEGLFTFGVDITEQVRARKLIQESNERYEYVTQATSDAIWEFVPATGKLYWGQGFNTLFGYDSLVDDTGIEKWLKKIHPEDIDRIETGVRQLLEGGQSKWDEEYRFKKSDGTYAHVRDNAIVIRDEDGNTERVVGAMGDITLKKQEEQQLKLMESVVTNTRDAVLITKAEPLDAPDGPEIVYVNEAFEKMTGYSAEDVIGATPRILQGPNTDFEALEEFGEKIRRWQPAEIETINYKKSGEEFWINFSVTPLANEKGCYTHWISVERDVTERKNRELKQKLISDVSRVFNSTESLRESLIKALECIQKLGNFNLAEIWLVNDGNNSIDLAASLEDQAESFYTNREEIESFEKGEGLPGVTWKQKKVQFWKNLDTNKAFVRKKAANNSGIKTAYGLPVLFNENVEGVLLLGVKDEPQTPHYFAPILEEIAIYLGDEIQRKRLEEELSRIFSAAPDGIIVAGFDGYLKRINPALCNILGYSEEELLSKPFIEFVHPDDREKTIKMYEEANTGTEKYYFENRYVTKSGQVKWLSWTFKVYHEEEVAYSVAKDITEIKETQELYDQASSMAKIGSWEVNLKTGDIYLSDTTEKIFGVEPGYNLILEEGINFYKEGPHREKIRKAVEQAIENGTPYDIELILVTQNGNEKWIRTIGEPEFRDGECVRIYGSIQDIHDFKSTELRLQNMTNNLPGIIFQYWLTPDGKDSVRYLSDGSSDIWGITAEVVMEDLDRVWAKIHKKDVEALRQSIIESAESLNKWHHVWRYNHPDGSLRWQEGIGTPQKLDDGTVFWDSIILDITEKKELEVLLDKSNRMAKVGSWNIEMESGQIFWSDTTKEIFEVEHTEELTAEKLFHFVADESHRNMLQNAVEKAVDSGEPYDLEVLIKTAKGRQKWIRTMGEPEFRDGECIQIFGSVQDIHDRKSAEENLKVKSRHIEAISKLNTALLNYQDWYNALNDHLEVIGEAVESDRVYYFENRYDPETGEGYTTQKLEWCREGIAAQQGNPEITDVPFSEVPEFINPMLDKKPSSWLVSELGEETLTRQVMENQDIKAFLAIPIYVENRFHGFVGFDNCTIEKHWSEEERTTLETITANLATAISRQHLDEQLKELLDEKNVILESISDAFYAVDDEWTITYFNREAENLLEVQASEVVGQNIWEIFPGAAETELYDHYKNVIENKEPLSFEYFYPPQEIWYDISAYPAEKGISVYFKDITDRKREQQLILDKTRQLDAIAQFNGQLITKENWMQALDNSLETFGSVAKADRVYFFENRRNEATRKLEASMKLEWVAEGIEPEIQNEAHQNQPLDEFSFLSNTLKKGKSVNYIVKHIENEKSRKFLEDQDIRSILIIPIFTGKNFRGYIGFDDCTHERAWSDEDISFLQTIAINLASAIENEDAEQALEEAFEEKNEILESIGDAFFAVDEEWTVTYWNNMAEEFLGMPKEKIVGKNLWDMYEDAVELDFYSQYHKAMEDQVMVHFEEYYPGTENWFEVSAYPSASGLSVFFKDVTERKEDEKRLKELNQSLAEKTKELERSNAELEQFAFVASHDLQEPLRMITGFLARLEKKYDHLLDEKGKKYIHFATDGAKRMRQIILDLLEFSRVGRIDHEREEVNLNNVVKEVHSLNKKLITESNTEIKSENLPVISAARVQMRQLFQNLIINAIKYRKEGKKPIVHIDWNEDENYWYFSVRDNGIGFNEEYKEKIFHIFQRLHGHDEYSGSGMGLAICKKIVEEHGGDILAESKEGVGSTFKFAIKKE